MASRRYQELETRVMLADNDWRTIVGNPYTIAYQQAYTKYQETLAKQKESDKEAGELFVTAACVATGSVLMGSIGSATMRLIARRTVFAVARRTLNSTMLRLFSPIRKNDGVAFAVGKVIDGLKDSAKKEANKLVEAYLAATSNVITPEPLVQYVQLDSFMRANINMTLRTARLIEQDSTLSGAERDAAYRELYQGPFLRTPVKRGLPFKASLPEIIELTFYLSAMLETDFLESVSAGVVTEFGSTARSTMRPIGQRPTELNYPKPPTPRVGAGGVIPAYQNVAIKRAGGDIQERTNTLTQQIFGTKVYGSTMFGFGGPADTDKSKELQFADRLLAQIAQKMKPQNPVDAIG